MGKLLTSWMFILLGICTAEANDSNTECIQHSESNEDEYDYRVCLFDSNAKKHCEKWKKDAEIFELCELEVAMDRERFIERMDEAMLWRTIKPLKIEFGK